MKKEPTDKRAALKMKKGGLLQLVNILSGLKVGKVSKDGTFALLDAKIALAPVIKEIERVQKTAAEELRPSALKEGVKNAVLEKEWNDKFAEYMNRFLEEEVSVSLPQLSRDDLYELVRENNLEISSAEVLDTLV